MKENINGVECEYEYVRRETNDGNTVVFLHGWGGGLESFSGAFRAVTDMGVPALNFAFPKKVPSDWGVYDYASYLNNFLRSKDISDPIVIGHSFGGRIGIITAAQGLCSKLMLVDSAGMRPHFCLRKKLAVARYHRSIKRGKPLDGSGSIDYNNTDPEMRGVFVRIVNTHLEKLLPYIKCPTLIVWGKTDGETPPYMAKRLNARIDGSRLEYLDGGHYAYVESHYGFVRLVKSFITE